MMDLNVQKEIVVGEIPVRKNMERGGKRRESSNSKRKRERGKEGWVET